MCDRNKSYGGYDKQKIRKNIHSSVVVEPKKQHYDDGVFDIVFTSDFDSDSLLGSVHNSKPPKKFLPMINVVGKKKIVPYGAHAG